MLHLLTSTDSSSGKHGVATRGRGARSLASVKTDWYDDSLRDALAAPRLSCTRSSPHKRRGFVSGDVFLGMHAFWACGRLTHLCMFGLCSATQESDTEYLPCIHGTRRYRTSHTTYLCRRGRGLAGKPGCDGGFASRDFVHRATLASGSVGTDVGRDSPQ